jgi:hypothetical protein
MHKRNMMVDDGHVLVARKLAWKVADVYRATPTTWQARYPAYSKQTDKL